MQTNLPVFPVGQSGVRAYRVLQWFPCFLRLGHTDDSNTFVGRTQALCPVYAAVLASTSALLLQFPFEAALLRGTAWHPCEMRLSEQHIFEHSSRPEMQEIPLDRLQESFPPTPLPPRFQDRAFPFRHLEQYGAFHWFGRGPIAVYEAFPAILPPLRA
jgi:hypothetical protein